MRAMTDMGECFKSFKSSRSIMLCLCCCFSPRPQFNTFSISAHSPPGPMPMYLAFGAGCSLEILPATSSFFFLSKMTGLCDVGMKVL